MSAVLKYRDIETHIRLPRSEIHCRIKLTKGKGRFITGETAWFFNTIVNNGLDGLAGTSFDLLTAYVHVGTGTTAETTTDSALETFVAASNTLQGSVSESAQSTAPYYGKTVRTRRFAEGVAEGNISEIAFSSQATTGSIFSRALVKDGGGSPTTISVQSDEWLDVTYEFRLYPDHILSGGGADDGSGSVTYDAVSYNYTIRPANVTNYIYHRALTCKAQLATVGTSYGITYGSDGALGAATSTPTGSSQDGLNTSTSSVAAATYSNGTYARDVSLIVGLEDGNVTGGVKALMFYSGMGAYQVLFNNPVPKDATKVWTFVTNFAWTRATIP